MVVAFMTVVVVAGLTWNLHYGLGPIVEPHINAVQLAFNLGQLGRQQGVSRHDGRVDLVFERGHGHHQ